VTASLSLYRLGTRLLEPVAPWFVEQRLKSGKERPDRIGERFGLTQAARPDSVLVWMHGASVGECRLLIDVFSGLKKRRPDVRALMTSQTLTAADMISGWKQQGVIHQMAPVDGPKAVERFLRHWRPDAAVFAEGEIWPNMLTGLKAHGVPAALVNARMTDSTLKSWNRRPAAARTVFSTFGFIGAADQTTADGLHAAIGRRIDVIGNLKGAAEVEGPSAAEIAAFRQATNGRPILLAASTHPGEDEFALNAFIEARMRAPGALLIIVPRHPNRGDDIVALMQSRNLTTRQWSKDRSPPGGGVDVLVADTMGELLFWYAAADAVYLGGATAQDIGGHNPVEPAQLGKRIFTGPGGFNFRETFDKLEQAGALTIGDSHQQLANWWTNELSAAEPAPALGSLFSSAQAPFAQSLDAILAMLPKAGSDA
jgi:3-deoxy-D-manno-octulosonic-acid transferase